MTLAASVAERPLFFFGKLSSTRLTPASRWSAPTRRYQRRAGTCTTHRGGGTSCQDKPITKHDGGCLVPGALTRRTEPMRIGFTRQDIRRIRRAMAAAQRKPDDKFVDQICELDPEAADRDRRLDRLIARVPMYRAAHILSSASHWAMHGRRSNRRELSDWLSGRARELFERMAPWQPGGSKDLLIRAGKPV